MVTSTAVLGCPLLCRSGLYDQDARCLPRCGDRVCAAQQSCVNGTCQGPDDGNGADDGGAASSGSSGGGSSTSLSGSASSGGVSSGGGASSSGGGGDGGPRDSGIPDGCVPVDCTSGGFGCGTPEDGCGVTLQCGECAQPQVCGLFVPFRCDLPDVEAPTVQFVLTPPAVGNGLEVVFQFNAQDAGGSGIAFYDCALDGQTPAQCQPPVVMTQVSAGAHVFRVTATDGAGNRSAPAAYAFTVDLEPPTCTLSAAPGCTTASQAWFAVSCHDDAGLYLVECQVDNEPFGPCTTATSLEVQDVGPGPHAVAVRALDRAGNRSQDVRVSWTVDVETPVVTLLQVPPLVTSAADATVRWRVDDLGGCGASALVCRLDGLLVGGCNSPRQFAVGPGPHTFCVEATDGAGNRGSSCASWQVDAAPPLLQLTPLVDQDPDLYNAVAYVPFAYTCTDTGSGCLAGSQVCTVDGSTADIDCGNGAGLITVGALPGGVHGFGAHTFELTVADVAGNTATASATFTVTRCAGDMQFANAPAGTRARGNCCRNLVAVSLYDMSRTYHPRMDGSCRPAGDQDGLALETPWPLGACATGLASAASLVTTSGACSMEGGAVCVASAVQADLLCAVGVASAPAQTPLGGRAGEGLYPLASAGCQNPAVLWSGALALRKGRENLCLAEPEAGQPRDAVGPADPCAASLGRYCRTAAPSQATACVCAAADPYADDGHR